MVFPRGIALDGIWHDQNTQWARGTRYSLRHRFKHWLSIQKEYLKFLVQITLKIDGFFLQWANIVDTLASQRTETAGSVRPQVDSPTWSDESSLLFVVHVLHLNLFVEEYTCGGHVGLDNYWPICKVGVHLFYYYYFYTRSCSDLFS